MAESSILRAERTHVVDDSETGTDHEKWVMVQKTGTQFTLNGQPFYVCGFNTYWLMVFAADHETSGKVNDVLHQASSVSLNVCRTWAFNDGGYRALQLSPGKYDEEVFKALDFVVEKARKHEIRLILSLCNNWEEFGGKPRYVKWGKEAGLNLTSDDDFFRDPTIKGYYKAHVKTVLTRVNTLTNIVYKDDPTILAWELINEPQCPSDPSGDTLQSWVEEMVSYIKSIDQNHLVEIGFEGFYGPSTPERLHLNPNTFANELGTDFIRNHQAPGLDFASVHIYTDSWLSNSLSGDHLVFLQNWMEGHIDDAQKVLKMPVIFGEFGVSLKDKRFNLEFREKFINTAYDIFLKSSEKGGSGGGCLIWQLFPEGTEHMDDGYAVVLPKSKVKSKMLTAHNVKQNTSFPSSPWKFPWATEEEKSDDVNSASTEEL